MSFNFFPLPAENGDLHCNYNNKNFEMYTKIIEICYKVFQKGIPSITNLI